MQGVGRRDWAGGISTLEQVPMEAPAVLEHCHGWGISEGGLVPELGCQARSTGTAITPATSPVSPAILKRDDGSWMFAEDSDGKLRIVRPDQTDAEWDAAVADIVGGAQSDARMVRSGQLTGMGDQLIIPGRTGVRRVDPYTIAKFASLAEWASDHGTYEVGDEVKRTLTLPTAEEVTIWFRCTVQHDSSVAEHVPGSGNYADNYWEPVQQLRSYLITPPGPTDYVDNAQPMAVTSNPPATYFMLHACEHNWDAIAVPAGCRAVITDLAGFSTLSPKQGSYSLEVTIDDTVAADTVVCSDATDSAPINGSASAMIGAWIYGFQRIYANDLAFVLYSDTACSVQLAQIALPEVAPGEWTFVSVQLPSGPDFSGISGVGLKYTRATALDYFRRFLVDQVSLMGTDEIQSEWKAEETPEYIYCHAYRMSGLLDAPYVLSKPSEPGMALEQVQDGALVTVYMSRAGLREDGITHLVVYRRMIESETVYYYAGIVDITAGFPTDNTVYLTDHGGYSTANPDMGLPQIMDIYRDPLPEAAYAMVCDSSLVLGCLNWDEENERWTMPATLAISSQGEPGYVPTSVPSDAAEGYGCYLDVPLQTGSRITGLGQWRSTRLVGCDTELFVLMGDNRLSYYLDRVAGIGMSSQRTFADCDSMAIWKSQDDFVGYAGGIPEPLGRWGIDPDLIDLDGAHDAVYFKGRYVLYCMYDGEPSLVIYDLATRGWRVEPWVELGGIVVDEVNNRLFGYTTDGVAVELFAGDYTLLGEERTFSFKTRWLEVARPGVNLGIYATVLDVDTTVQAGIDVEVQIESKGPENEDSWDVGEAPRDVTVTPGGSTYEIGTPLVGHAVRATIEYTGAYPPKIRYVGWKVSQGVAA